MSLSVSQLLAEACGRQLKGVSELTDAEMTMIGVERGDQGTDVCAGVASRP
jgi:hypothetical protein